MAEMGWCPSGRLFEAAACGAAIVTDFWPGLDAFFEPGEEIIPVSTTDDVLAALELGGEELGRIARNARDRVLAEHTSDRRAQQFEAMLSGSLRQPDRPQPAMEAF
jgi:spore maturation protein CgeB